MSSYIRNSNRDIPQAPESTYAQRMEAFDRLPKSVRQELSTALLDYTAIDFYVEYRKGMQPLALLEVLWKANVRDHITGVRNREVAPIPSDRLNSYKFSPDPIRAGRISVRETRLSKLRGSGPRAGRAWA